MESAPQSLFARNDTMFGVCEALGEDFGFNPLFLRITLAVLLLWNPVLILSSYAAAGVAIALSRWLFPTARRTAAQADASGDVAAPAMLAAPRAPARNTDTEILPIAA